MSIAAGVYRGSLCENVSAIEGYFSVAFPQLYEALHWMHDSWRPPPQQQEQQQSVQQKHSDDRFAIQTETADVFTLLVVEYVNYYCVFLWTFMDVFIVAISLCLTLRFRQLNEHIERHRGLVGTAAFFGRKQLYNWIHLQNMPTQFWQAQRQSFSSLSKLCVQVDESISIITTFSVSNNLYFLLIQLLHSFQ